MLIDKGKKEEKRGTFSAVCVSVKSGEQQQWESSDDDGREWNWLCVRESDLVNGTRSLVICVNPREESWRKTASFRVSFFRREENLSLVKVVGEENSCTHDQEQVVEEYAVVEVVFSYINHRKIPFQAKK